MNKRKALSLVIVFTLAFSMLFGSTALADTISEQKLKVMQAAGEIAPPNQPSESSVKIKKEQALEIAKKMLEDPTSFEVGYISLNPKWGTQGATWHIDMYRRQAPGGNANFGIDADTGKLINFNIWENTDGQTNFVAKLTRAEARVKAEEFLKTQMKEDLTDYELQKEDPYASSYRTGGVKEQILYNFNYIKKINGIPFSNYNLNIGVDGTNGKVRSLYTNPIDISTISFPASSVVKPANQALDKYKESVNFALQYITTYEQKSYGPSKPKVMLAYVPATYINMLDAKTLKPINYDGTVLSASAAQMQSAFENPVPLAPGTKLDSRETSEEDAKKIAEKLKTAVEGLLGITFDNNNQSMPIARYYNGADDVYNFNWNKNTEKENAYMNVAISSKTGHVINLNFNKWSREYEMKMAAGTAQQKEIKETVNWKQGKAEAIKILKQIIPEQYGFYTDLNIVEPTLTAEAKKFMREYNYGFTRVENGILYRDNTANVSIERETGKLLNFHMNWNDVEFPKADNVVPKEEAQAKYFDGTETKLGYFTGTTYDSKTGQPKQSTEAKLVYTFTTKGYMYGSLMVDAMTGKLIDWSGREFKLEASTGEPALADHWAKRSMELLIAQGIIKNPFVEYTAGVTRGEAVKMLSLSKGMWYYDPAQMTEPSFTDVSKDSDYYTYVETALKNKILTEKGGEFKAGEVITKEEFVKLLVNMMGYADIAKHSEIFTLTGVENVSEAMKGYVAVCKALDVLPVETGKSFDGKASLTYAEAASALYKALSFIK